MWRIENQFWLALIPQTYRPAFAAMQWLAPLQQSVDRIVESQPRSALVLVFGIQKHTPCWLGETGETTRHSFSESYYVMLRHGHY